MLARLPRITAGLSPSTPSPMASPRRSPAAHLLALRSLFDHGRRTRRLHIALSLLIDDAVRPRRRARRPRSVARRQPNAARHTSSRSLRGNIAPLGSGLLYFACSSPWPVAVLARHGPRRQPSDLGLGSDMLYSRDVGEPRGAPGAPADQSACRSPQIALSSVHANRARLSLASVFGMPSQRTRRGVDMSPGAYCGRDLAE